MALTHSVIMYGTGGSKHIPMHSHPQPSAAGLGGCRSLTESLNCECVGVLPAGGRGWGNRGGEFECEVSKRWHSATAGSQVIPQPSTDAAQLRLTSQF